MGQGLPRRDGEAVSRVVHVAGQPIRVANRTRQRCSWCEVAIIDDDLSCMASTDPPPEPYGVHVFPVGAFVAVEERGGVRQTSVIDDEHVETGEHGSSVIKIPVGFCADPAHGERPKLELVKP